VRFLRSSVLFAALIAALTPLGTAAQEQVRQTPQGVVLNFQNVELSYVVAALAQAAGVNVVASSLPQTQVTLRTAEPVAVEDIEGLLRQLAEAHGVAVSESNGFLRLQGPLSAEQALPPRNLYVFRLKHANATLLSGTLRALFGGAIPQVQRSAGPQTLSQQLQSMEQQGAAQLVGIAGAAGGQQIVVQGGGAGELEGSVQIVPEETTNTLLVRATEADWAIIEQAIQALDLRPLQVVIEVIIAEVRRSDDLNLGTAFSIGDPDGETTADLPSTAGEGDFSLRIIRPGGDIDVDATLSALASTGNVRILSRPVIQAQNNQEARILVGDQRPFVQVSRTLATDQGARDEIIQYRDVGTALTILPIINEEGYVNLLVTQEVSSATSETQFGAPVISTREATTQLLARTGQTIVIGGLVDQQTEEVRSGIPLLKDIPILGLLFGSTRRNATHSELFLFLTPYIVASDEDADLLRQEIEQNLDLLRMLIPLKSSLPPSLRILIPDSIGGGEGGR
jgi:general secretion pathway protein D